MAINFSSDPPGNKQTTTKTPNRTPTLLVTDDEDVLRGLLVRILRRSEYQVLDADSAESALDIVQRHDGKVDLLISDIHMRQMDGFHLFEKLRKTNPNIRAIFISGSSSEGGSPSRLPHATLFLGKPFDAGALLSAVRDALK